MSQKKLSVCWDIFSYKIKEDFFFEKIAKENFLFFIFGESSDTNKIKDFAKELEKDITYTALKKLKDLEVLIFSKEKKFDLSHDISYGAIYVKENEIVYLKTKNQARIYLYRQGKFGKIIDSDFSASGFLKENDLFLITNLGYFEGMNKDDIVRIFSCHELKEMVYEIKNHATRQDTFNQVAIIVKFSGVVQDKFGFSLKNQIAEEELKINQQKITKSIFSYKEFYFLKDRKNIFSFLNKGFFVKKKLLNSLIITGIIIVLTWSVFLGAKRREERIIHQKIVELKSQVDNKLNLARDEAFFNLEQAENLLQETEKLVREAENELKDNNEIKKIKERIKKIKKEILKKEEKNVDEYFDLTIENKNTQGDSLYLDGESLIIYDKKNNSIYSLLLSKKKFEEITKLSFNNQGLLASSDGDIYFYLPNQGIFLKRKTEKDFKKIVEEEVLRNPIVDFVTYGKNLYLLDVKNSAIYKYTPKSQDSYSKIIYFQGGPGVFKEGKSLAIDGAVYVLVGKTVFKFLGGTQQDFRINFPNKEIDLKKIFTNRFLEKIFIWDKKNSSIYIFNKNRQYEREITTALLKTANDFVVFENKIFVLERSKIFTISLD